MLGFPSRRRPVAGVAGERCCTQRTALPALLVSLSDEFGVQVRVMAVPSHQVVMRAALRNLSMLQHKDLMSVSHGREPMRNDKGGSAGKQLFQRVLDEPFGLLINRAGSFVQDQ